MGHCSFLKHQDHLHLEKLPFQTDLKSDLWGWTANKQFSGELGSPTLRHPYIVTGFLESGDSLALRLSYHEIP